MAQQNHLVTMEDFARWVNSRRQGQARRLGRVHGQPGGAAGVPGRLRLQALLRPAPRPRRRRHGGHRAGRGRGHLWGERRHGLRDRRRDRRARPGAAAGHQACADGLRTLPRGPAGDARRLSGDPRPAEPGFCRAGRRDAARRSTPRSPSTARTWTRSRRAGSKRRACSSSDARWRSPGADPAAGARRGRARRAAVPDARAQPADLRPAGRDRRGGGASGDLAGRGARRCRVAAARADRLAGS